MLTYQIISSEPILKEFKPLAIAKQKNANDIDPDFHQNQIKINKNSQALTQIKREISIEISQKSQEVWDRITSRFELSNPLKTKIKSLDILEKNISNAFLKALELFNQVKRPLSNNDLLFDNASLPGDFIRAWLYLGGSKNWRANSLLSKNALEDRFNLLKENPKQWMMSTGMDGDVTSLKNILNIVKTLEEEKWQPTIYISDLGFKINNPFKEEDEHFWPNFGQILLGLKILKPGKDSVFIIKMFSGLENKSQFLIQTCLQAFDILQICKPETSKRDNSEIYIIGIGYKGYDTKDLEGMLDMKILPPLVHWNTQITNTVETLISGQVEKLKNNLSAFQRYKSPPSMDKEVDDWISKYLRGRT